MQYHIGKKLIVAKAIAQPKIKSYGAFSTIKASDLMRQPRVARRDVVPGIIPDGVTILAAMPKKGKSRLMTALSLAVAKGGMFAGRAVGRTGSVLYLDLEEEADLVLERFDAFDPKRARNALKLELSFSVDGKPAAILESLRLWALEHADAALVIVDVWANFHKKGAMGRNYEEQYKALDLLTEFSRAYDIPVVIVTHTTKFIGKPGDLRALSGSVAQSAAPSTIILMDTHEAVTDLRITSRKMQAAHYQYPAGQEMGDWTAVGENTSSPPEDRSAQVLAMFSNGSAKLTLGEIAAAVFDANKNATAAHLSRMTSAELLKRIAKGVFGLP